MEKSAAAAAAKSLPSRPTLRPQRWQPTRLCHPWDSPGKNTGVGCHFLLQCMRVKSESEVAQSCLTSLPHGLQPTRLLHPWDFPVMPNSVQPHRWQPTRLLCPWDSPGKNTGMGCHFLLQCVKVKSGSEVAQSFPTLSNPMDYSLPGSSAHGIFQARVLEWVAIAFSNDQGKYLVNK